MSTRQPRRRRAHDFSALPALGAYVVLLVGIPSELVFAPLGAAGAPASVLAVGLMLWWVGGVAVTGRSSVTGNPMKWLLLVFAVALLTSYVFGMSRPIGDAVEVNSADRALLSLIGWLGVGLLVADGLQTRARLDTLLRVLVGGAGFIAFLGLLQFFFDLDLAHLINIPGLSANGSFGELIERSTFRRVTGTASHPIEFGVVLSAVLPLAVHYARYAKTSGSRIWLWVAVGLMAAALPLSVARSGMVGFGIALAVMFFTWPPRFQRKVLLGIIAGMATAAAVVPGLIGTFRSLFLNAANDPSTGGRTADYGPVFEYVAQAPLFGRGFGTFIPSLYRTLDNQYLGLLVETGFVGLCSVLALFVGAGYLVVRSRRRSKEGERRDLAQSLLAALAVLAVSAFTFDMFGFSMCAGLTFLILGAAGAMVSQETTDEVVVRRLTFTTTAAVAGIAVLIVCAGAAASHFSRAEYDATASLVLNPPEGATTSFLATAGRASTAASILHDVIEDESTRDGLRDEGVGSFDVAIGDGSLMMGTDRQGSGGSVLNLITRSGSAADSDGAMQTLVETLRAQLVRIQTDIGVPPSEWINLKVVSVNPAYAVRGRTARSLAAAGILGLLTACVLIHVMRRRRVTPPPSTRTRVRTGASP